MIQGVNKKELTVSMILETLTPEDIYYKYFGAFKVNEPTRNWMRRETDPSFIIGNRSGSLRHYDFSDFKWRGNCFNFVMQMFNCNFNDALKIINDDFGLGLLGPNGSGIQKEIVRYTPEVIEKQYSTIQMKVRRFLPLELKYWKAYDISEDDLNREKIYSIKELYLNKKRFPLPDDELRFGYLYGSSIKTYRPTCDAKHKWMPNNVPITTLDGKEFIDSLTEPCDVLWITKSKKDYMVLKKLYPYVIATQNESVGCFNKANVDWILSKSKKQVLMFDSDKTGVKNSIAITEQFGFQYFNIPKSYLSDGITDPSDIVRYYGIDKLEMLLIKKGLLVA